MFHRRVIVATSLGVGSFLAAFGLSNRDDAHAAPGSQHGSPAPASGSAPTGLPTQRDVHDSITRLVTRLRVAQPQGANVQPDPDRARVIARLEAAARSMLDPGSESQARAYYQAVEAELGLQLNVDEAPIARLTDLLEFLGYGGIDPTELEQLPSDTLMDPVALGSVPRNPDRFHPYFATKPLQAGEIVVTRFFAPKIADMSNFVAGSSENGFGWRKLVRLNSRPCSPAERKGIASAYVLFNFLLPLGQDEQGRPTPFGGQVSKNNQAMLVRRPGGAPARPECSQPGAANQLTDPAYWLVFGTTEQSAPLEYALSGVSFELPASTPDGGKYFVPNACARCHGGGREFAKLNFLDTDHWFDRIEPGDDFSALKNANAPAVLFDGGRDAASPQFEKAFETLVTLNREIQAQNSHADNGGLSPQGLSVDKWMALHAPSPGQRVLEHKPPIDRALETTDGRIWDRTQPAEVELLGLLNRFCYRCHSSINFSVFDRSAIGSRAVHDACIPQFLIKDNVMPIDRTLKSLDAPLQVDQRDALSRLLGLLDQVFNGGETCRLPGA